MYVHLIIPQNITFMKIMYSKGENMLDVKQNMFKSSK